jgi:hypothetical protein
MKHSSWLILAGIIGTILSIDVGMLIRIYGGEPLTAWYISTGLYMTVGLPIFSLGIVCKMKGE